MNSINSPTIPISLSNLLERASFIASAEDSCKPCFSGEFYVEPESYVNYAWRKFVRGETALTTRNHIQSVCEELSQALVHYQGTVFHSIIIDHMVKVRLGITRIREAYKKPKKDYKTISSLNTSILTLDLNLPNDVKMAYGIIPAVLSEG